MINEGKGVLGIEYRFISSSVIEISYSDAQIPLNSTRENDIVLVNRLKEAVTLTTYTIDPLASRASSYHILSYTSAKNIYISSPLPITILPGQYSHIAISNKEATNTI